MITISSLFIITLKVTFNAGLYYNLKKIINVTDVQMHFLCNDDMTVKGFAGTKTY